MMHAYYGIREVKITDQQPNAMGEIEQVTRTGLYDFSQLPVDALDLNINIGAASYWAETLQTATLDNLMNAQIIPNPVEYLERVPEGMVRDKPGLIDAVKRAQEKAAQAAMYQQSGGGVLA